jgi:hypothetical protein
VSDDREIDAGLDAIRKRAQSARDSAALSRTATRAALTQLHETLGRFGARPAAGEVAASADDPPAIDGVVSREDFDRAMATRTTIGMALGIVMERYGLTERSAWDLLGRLANEREVKLAVLASQVVSSTGEGADESGPGHRETGPAPRG